MFGLSALVGCGKPGGDEASGAPAAGSAPKAETQKAVELLNVSYDPTRELWRDLNERFIASYEKTTGYESDDQAVARRLEHAGARRHRRARGRRRDARVVSRHRRHQQEGADQAGLGRPAAEPIAARTRRRSSSSSARATRRASRTGPISSSRASRSSRRTRRRRATASCRFFSAWGSVVLRGGSREDAHRRS